MDDLFGYYHIPLEDELDFDASEYLQDSWVEAKTLEIDDYLNGND